MKYIVYNHSNSPTHLTGKYRFFGDNDAVAQVKITGIVLNFYSNG